MSKAADGVSIRPMEACDLDGVMAIEHLCFSTPWSEDSFRRELEQSAARYLVLTVDGVVAGYAGVWLVIDEGHVTNVAVHPDYQGRGYGRRIFTRLMEVARENGVSWMTLEVRRSNARAQKLYESLGFTGIGYRKRYYEDNQEDALIMVNEKIWS